MFLSDIINRNALIALNMFENNISLWNAIVLNLLVITKRQFVLRRDRFLVVIYLRKYDFKIIYL